MAAVLAVFWTWKVALGVLGAAAAVWFLLAAFVASRWPAVYPWLGHLRPSRVRAALVGVLVALAVGGALLARPAYARSRDHADEYGRRRAGERRLVLSSPERRVMIRANAFGQPQLTMVHSSPCAHENTRIELASATLA